MDHHGELLDPEQQPDHHRPTCSQAATGPHQRKEGSATIGQVAVAALSPSFALVSAILLSWRGGLGMCPVNEFLRLDTPDLHSFPGHQWDNAGALFFWYVCLGPHQGDVQALDQDQTPKDDQHVTDIAQQAYGNEIAAQIFARVDALLLADRAGDQDDEPNEYPYGVADE